MVVLRRLLIVCGLGLAAALVPGIALAHTLTAPAATPAGGGHHGPPSTPPPQWLFTLTRQELDHLAAPFDPADPDPEPPDDPTPNRGPARAPAKARPSGRAAGGSRTAGTVALRGPRPGLVGAVQDYADGFAEGAEPYVLLSTPTGQLTMMLAAARAGIGFGTLAATDPDAAVEQAKAFAIGSAKDMVAWDDWAAGRYARAAGRLTPDIALTLLTGGLGKVAEAGARPAAEVATSAVTRAAEVGAEETSARAVALAPGRALLPSGELATALRQAGAAVDDLLEEASGAGPRLAVETAKAEAPAWLAAPAAKVRMRADGPLVRIDATNVVDAEALGGHIDYGRIDPRTLQRSGVKAVVTPEMVEAAHARELGSHAHPKILPPGLEKLPVRNRARGHLLGRQLGGSGLDERNLVALWQYPVNDPIMSGYETMVANAIRKGGETMRYDVTPVYSSRWPSSRPIALRLEAWGLKGFRLDVEIPNRRWVELPPEIPNETVGARASRIRRLPTPPGRRPGRVRVHIAPPDGFWGHEGW